MKTNNKILVCGASIAGPAVAYWLHKYGYSVVIAERAKDFRTGGQNVDIKGAGKQIAKMMKIDTAIDAMNTGEQGLKVLDRSGRILSRLPKGAVGGLTQDNEILRGDLAKVFFDVTQDKCEYRFGKFVTGLVEKSDSIAVTFNDGATEDFELVICADGIGSSTRQLVMPEKVHFNYLGAYMSYFKIPFLPEDGDRWAALYQAQGGALIVLRPHGGNKTTVQVTFPKDKFENNWHDVTKQRELLRDVLSGKGGLADRVAANLDYDSDIYFGPMSQVKASSWSAGRVVLIGDAAHAPTPFTGSGTDLALTGAYILAGEISKNDDYSSAFQSYEKIVRPYVEKSQSQITARSIRLLHQKSLFGITIFRLIVGVVASTLFQKVFRNLSLETSSNERFDLPEYGGT